MGWLRRQGDCIALVLAWALLLQSALLGFASAAHAASLASGTGEAVVMCTSKGIAAKEAPAQKRHGSHGQCCTLACRLSCAGTASIGVLPNLASIPAPATVLILRKMPRLEALPRISADGLSARPRAPPAA